MARELSKDLKEWKRGKDLADEMARHTVTGESLDNGAPRYSVRWRAFLVGIRVWDRLLNWNSRPESEIRDAAQKIGKIIDLDNEAVSQDGELPLDLNKFTESGRLETEVEWLTQVHGLGDPDDNTFPALLNQIGLSGWQPWEILYVLALRMIDDAIRRHVDGQIDLAETLLLKAMDEICLADMYAHGKHRNTEYLFHKRERELAEKEKQFWLNDAKPKLLQERQKDIATRPRGDALTLAIREFAKCYPDATHKELQKHLLNHDSLRCRAIGETLEWEASNGESGEAQISGLPARLSRARMRRVAKQ